MVAVAETGEAARLKAKSLAREFEREISDQANFRTLWQETADFAFPRDGKIQRLSLIHISEPTRPNAPSGMPSSA